MLTPLVGATQCVPNGASAFKPLSSFLVVRGLTVIHDRGGGASADAQHVVGQALWGGVGGTGEQSAVAGALGALAKLFLCVAPGCAKGVLQ